jgi:uncharacterized protein YjbJ (UPF0337 family)
MAGTSFMRCMEGGHDGLEPGRRKLEANERHREAAVGKLTDDDLTQINGSREKLEGIIQERYGIARDETRKQIDSWYQNQGWQ